MIEYGTVLCVSVLRMCVFVVLLRATALCCKRALLLQFRLSVHLSVTRVIHAKRVVVRIVQFSPYSSPIPLVFAW